MRSKSRPPSGWRSPPTGVRAAPAVSASLDDCRPERVLIALLYGGTGAALVAWAATPSLAGGPAAIWPVLGWLAGGAVGWQVARWLLPGGWAALGWDGQAWSLTQRASPGAVVVTPVADLRWLLDLGPWLLLRAHCGSSQPRWLVLRQRRVGADWHLLRVALTAHARGHR